MCWKKRWVKKLFPWILQGFQKCIWMHEKCPIFSVLYFTIFGMNAESYKGFHNTRPYTMSNKFKYKVFLCFSILTNAEFHEHHSLVFYRITILEHSLKFTGKHLQCNPTHSKIGCAQNPENWKIRIEKHFLQSDS